MVINVDQASTASPQSLVGTWRRFGETGPVYEILGFQPMETVNDCLMRIRLVETGEEFDYPLSNIVEDPTAR